MNHEHDQGDLGPRHPRPPADKALDIVEIELAAALALLRDLDAADWQRPTACTD